MSRPISVVITGIGIEIPGIEGCSTFLESLTRPLQPTPFQPAAKLGSKGLLYKDQATQLAFCAAKAALEDARLPVTAAEQKSAEDFGVVVSSNLGNADTVCRAAETIRNSHVKNTSPLDLPNASSNVVASSLAIRFGCQALNLMLCNGATSGTDALFVAANAIRTRRAQRMLVVAVEPTNSVVSKMWQESEMNWLGSSGTVLHYSVSAAMILESAEVAAQRNANIYGRVDRYCYTPPTELGCDPFSVFSRDNIDAALWLTPSCAYPTTTAIVKAIQEKWGDMRPELLDISVALGETYGAAGILQAIAACLWLQKRGGKAWITTGAAWGDGCASISIHTESQHVVA